MKNLYLIGMIGCGKSTCAGLLGERLGLPVLDTDGEIVRETGMTVSELFARYGEAHFRDLETDLCRRLARTGDTVVACGGGLPLRAENRAYLWDSGTVIFLRRDPGKIYDTADMSGRPLGQGGREDFLLRYAGREPVYLSAAGLTIGDFDTPEETVEEILRRLQKEGLWNRD